MTPSTIPSQSPPVLGRPSRFVALLAAIAAAVVISPIHRVAAEIPVFRSGNPGDLFKAIGVTPEGAQIVVGRRGPDAGFFEWQGEQLKFTPIGVEALDPIVNPLSLYPEKHISRDGRYVIARGQDERVTLWDRVIGRPIVIPGRRVWPYPWPVSVASVGGEPVVAGRSIDETDIRPTWWSPSEGFRVEKGASPWASFDALTVDGRVAGVGSIAGEYKGFVGTPTRFDTVLQRYGNDTIGITAISPNGHIVSGWQAFPPFRAAFLWTDGVPKHLHLSPDQPATLTGAISDSGFAGGMKVDLQPTARAYIYDPTIGGVRWFDEWWRSKFAATPLPSPATNVVDLLDHEGDLLMVLQGPLSQIATVPRAALAPSPSTLAVGNTFTPSTSPSPTTDESVAQGAEPNPAVTENSPSQLATRRLARPHAPAPSIARIWNEEALSAIRIDLPNPPAHARNLFHLSVAMFDAWSAFEPTAPGVIYHGKHSAANLDSARHEAISYAAYRILRERYTLSRNAVQTLFILDSRFRSLGYNPDNLSQDPSTPAGVGNRVATAVSTFYAEDGARQAQNYKDPTPYNGGYAPFNPPLVTLISGVTCWDINQWQPLSISGATSQNGIPLETVQSYQAPQWGRVRPFALTREDDSRPWIDPGPPPRLGTATDAQFRDEVVRVIRHSSELTPEDGAELDISPGAFGNNPLGSNSGQGYPLNPVTGNPYPPNRVKRGDFARILAEFWADGPTSETPPGHWNTIANYVTDHPAFTRRMGGTGPALSQLEWDVKMYFALNGALHDAACAAWTLKRYYNGWRPITAIRLMGQRGQSTDPNGPLYHPDGLPLVPNLIEVQSIPIPGGQGITVPTLMIRTWRGQPADPLAQIGGVGWIPANSWLPYQRRTFITPAFPGYVSGHSTFSRAAAEVLTELTGSPYFPGGLGTFLAPANRFLFFEKGPTTDVELQWATYYDAADQAGISRIWGGIHPSVDDFTGRRVGSQVGKNAWNLAKRYFDGSIQTAIVDLQIRPAGPTQCELRFKAIRGMSYLLQSTPDLSIPFTNDPSGAFTATDTSAVRVEADFGSSRYYRIVTMQSPAN